MKIKNILLILVLSLLVTQSSPGQTNTGGEIAGLLTKLKDSPEGPERVDILLKLCQAHMGSDPGKALDYAKQGLALSKKINYHKGISDSFHLLGVYYFYQGNYSNALEYYSKSLNLKEELGDRKGAARCYNNIGIIYAEQGNYPKALEFYDKSIKIMEELGDKKFISYAYINIGLFYQKTGNYPKALESYFKSLKITEELKDKKGISISYNNIATVYERIGNYQNALEYNFKSLKIKEELGDKTAISYSYHNIGLAYFGQENYSSALEYYSKSLNLSEELGDKNHIANSYSDIGKTQLQLKNVAEALAFYLKSKKMFEEIGSKPKLSDAYLGIGKCYSARGETKKAIDNLTRALNIARDIKLPETIKDTAEELSNAYEKIGQYKQAHQYHKLFKETSDGLINKEKDKKITQLEMQYEFDKKQRQVQIELMKRKNQVQIELEKRKNLRTAFIFSSALLVLLLFFIYSRFHLKKKANRIIQAEKEKAVKANRAKSEFLANMSHELRTPLNAVIGFSELLSSMAVDQKQRNYTHSIRAAGKSLLKLINDILDLSKIESGMMGIRYAPVNPIMIFNEIEQIFREKLVRKNLTYITDIDETLPNILFLDETRLRQILLNLVGNAVKFTVDGHVKLSAKQAVKTDRSDPSARTPGMSARTPGQIDLIISVEDTGIGIPQEEQGRIFEPFQQQSGQSIREYGGTGLGLSICKRLTEMMKGRISVESQPGKGSCFKLMLENVKVPSAEVVAVQENESFNLDSITFESARVLVVDDVESNRAMLEEMLPRVNLEVLSAENGREALRIAGEYVPDVIIMDIKMPEMDGYEAANALKSNPKTKDIPILVLSASSSVEQKEKILESGFFATYLDKPVDVNRLFKELSNYIPYSRTAEPASPGVDDRIRFKDLPQETLKRLPGLIKILQQEMLPLTEHFKGALRTEEVKKFADKVKRLGEDFAVPGLIDYANRLNRFEQEFDIEGIEKTLADFPTMVKDLVLHMEVYDASR